MNERSASPAAPIRVAIVHPALPKYRVPVFRELARRPGIQLKVVYGAMPNLANAQPDGFEGEYVPIQIRRLGHQPIYWDVSQWRYGDRALADVMIAEWDVHYAASLVPALLHAKFNRVPTLLWGHGISKNESPARLFLRDQLARLANGLIFYNHIGANIFQQRGWDPRRLFVAINSLDQSAIGAARAHWLTNPDALEQFRREQGLAGGPVVLFVSRLDSHNRLDWLLQAARLMAPKYPGLKIAIVGKGPDDERLRGLVESLGLAKQVLFAGAIYDEMKLAPWFLSAKVFCYPTNIGLSILHSMGYGLPVITSDSTERQNPEIEALISGENGLVYRHGDVASLAETIGRILDDPALAERLSRGALRTIAERFNLEKMVDGLVAAIRYAHSQNKR